MKVTMQNALYSYYKYILTNIFQNLLSFYLSLNFASCKYLIDYY